MHRYIIDWWRAVGRDIEVSEAFRYLRQSHKSVYHQISDALDWLVFMEIDHHYAFEEAEGLFSAYLVIARDEDAFAFRMAWNYLPVDPKKTPEQQCAVMMQEQGRIRKNPGFALRVFRRSPIGAAVGPSPGPTASV